MSSIKTIAELKSLRKPIVNVNKLQRSKLTKLEKLATVITKTVGSVGFFSIIFVWTISWLIWNTLGPIGLRFDPFPAFVLWLFISNMIQIFLMPLIMLGQNLQGDHAEARAESDYEINIKAEREIEVILLHLEKQNELILSLEKRIEEQVNLLKNIK